MTPRERVKWWIWLAAGLLIWLAGAFLVTFYLKGRGGAAGIAECAASCVYLSVLLAVLAIGNFARVRLLLLLEIVYGVAVIVRAVLGILISLLLIEQPLSENWNHILDTLAAPFAGLEYIAAQLTAHFITEIYWLGLALIATILVFLLCAAMMAVGTRIRRDRERERRRRQTLSAAARRAAANRRASRDAVDALTASLPSISKNNDSDDDKKS
jgi:Na+-transporting methylmalonyl-CoA/oxaloacetate decarboxylase gamma subunit